MRILNKNFKLFKILRNNWHLKKSIFFDLWFNHAIWFSGHRKKQNTTFNDIKRLQNKAVKIIYFKSKHDAVHPAYKKSNPQAEGYVHSQFVYSQNSTKYELTYFQSLD